MASLELCSLSEHLDDNTIEALCEQLESADAAPLNLDEDVQHIALEQVLDEDAFADFWDQLDANEAACDVYLPVEFEETFTVKGKTYGSAHALLLALANLKEEMFVEDDEEEEEEFDDDFDDDIEGDIDDDYDDYGGDDDSFGHSDEDSPIELKDEQMRMVWRAIHKGARLSVTKQLPLFVHS